MMVGSAVRMLAKIVAGGGIQILQTISAALGQR
jgi:hypothetical protein